MAKKDEQENPLSELAALGSKLAQFADDRAERRKVLDEILDAVQKLSPADRKALVQSEAFAGIVQVADDTPPSFEGVRPGQTVGKGLTAHKKPWTWADLKSMPTKTFIPVTTEMVFWNGLGVQLKAFEEITLPECFHGIYMDSLSQRKFAHEHAAWLFRKSDQMPAGAGMTPEEARVRGVGTGGWFQPGAGNIAGATTTLEEGEGGTSGEAA